MTTAETQESGWIPGTSSFGARLALVRNYLNLNVKQAAERAGVDDSSWSMWEQGREPRKLLATVAQISEALGCDEYWLLTGRADPGLITDRYSADEEHIIPSDLSELAALASAA